MTKSSINIYTQEDIIAVSESDVPTVQNIAVGELVEAVPVGVSYGLDVQGDARITGGL
jgi:hypothetical protein